MQVTFEGDMQGPIRSSATALPAEILHFATVWVGISQATGVSRHFYLTNTTSIEIKSLYTMFTAMLPDESSVLVSDTLFDY